MHVEGESRFAAVDRARTAGPGRIRHSVFHSAKGAVSEPAHSGDGGGHSGSAGGTMYHSMNSEHLASTSNVSCHALRKTLPPE